MVCQHASTRNFHPQDERFAEYDRAFDTGLKHILARRESETFFEGRFGLYGLRNFGDHFGSDGMNWDNLEYDFSHCCLTQYMRTGDLRLLQIGRECHLHNRDVDCLTVRPGFERLCHHTGDHNMNLAGAGHTWCEGAWEYYFLTGDRRSARKALGISNDLAYRITGLVRTGSSRGRRIVRFRMVGCGLDGRLSRNRGPALPECGARGGGGGRANSAPLRRRVDQTVFHRSLFSCTRPRRPRLFHAGHCA